MTPLTIYATLWCLTAALVIWAQGRPVTRESVGAGLVAGLLWPVTLVLAAALLWAYFDEEENSDE